MPFRFLDLPPELRNRIYEFALDLHGPLIPSVCTHKKASAVQPALTRLCRAVRYEALPVFYGVNEFVAHVHGCDFGYFIGWMNAIGARSQQDMRVVWVRLADRWQCARGLLDFVRWCSTCTNTELEFKMDVQMWNGTHSWMMDMTELEELEKNDMRFMGATADALAGAIDLARQLRMTHTMTECTVRRAFFKWLGEIEFDCSGQRCSEFEDDFDGLCSVANSIARGPSECCKVDEDEVIVNV